MFVCAAASFFRFPSAAKTRGVNGTSQQHRLSERQDSDSWQRLSTPREQKDLGRRRSRPGLSRTRAAGGESTNSSPVARPGIESDSRRAICLTASTSLFCRSPAGRRTARLLISTDCRRPRSLFLPADKFYGRLTFRRVGRYTRARSWLPAEPPPVISWLTPPGRAGRSSHLFDYRRSSGVASRTINDVSDYLSMPEVKGQ